MISLNRTRTVQGSPQQLFALLADTDKLTQILPRVWQVELLELHTDHARMVTHMSIGYGFGSIRCAGELHWIEPQQITFLVRKPLPVENSWQFTPIPEGTRINVALQLDLTPLLGPFSQFVPTITITNLLSKDIDTALQRIESFCKQHDTQSRATIPAQ